MTVRELADGDLNKLRLSPGSKGVLVTEIEPNTPAADKLEPGDVIETVNQEPVPSLNEYTKQVRRLTPGQMVVLSIFHERNRTVVVLSPE